MCDSLFFLKIALELITKNFQKSVNFQVAYEGDRNVYFSFWRKIN